MVGEWPISVEQFQAVPTMKPEGAFGVVQSRGEQAWVPLPGWQVVMTAQDAIAFLAPLNALTDTTITETVLVLVDRQQKIWDDSSYFVVTDDGGQLIMRWFDTEPSASLLGRVIVIVRPKKILDESYTQELWQIDE